MARKIFYIFSAFFACLILMNCDGFKLPEKIFESSARERYERNFSGSDSVLNQWKASYNAALNSNLQIKDGTAFLFANDSIKLNAVGYLVDVKRGDLLIVETANLSPETKIFVDIFPQTSSSENQKSQLAENGKFQKVAEESGFYKVVIQPEVAFQNNFQLKIYTQPSIGFPVAGKGNRDVQSFWGASRDGGGRSHEGVDIFAKRGTPVVAVTDGFVRRTGNQGLGGKQVWQRDGLLGNSYYYAHLDSIMTTDGQKLKAGDTVGTVGNTGNAAGGATHLHFGIYSSGGAVDPYPFIKKREIPAYLPALNDFKKTKLKAETDIKISPDAKSETVFTLKKETETVAKSVFTNWLHIQLSDGREGFVFKNRFK